MKIIKKYFFFRIDGTTLTPLIFTKKNQPVKQQKPLSPHIVAFENYLHLITQMYYKKNFNLNESISNFEGTIKEGMTKITKKTLVSL